MGVLRPRKNLTMLAEPHFTEHDPATAAAAKVRYQRGGGLGCPAPQEFKHASRAALHGARPAKAVLGRSPANLGVRWC